MKMRLLSLLWLAYLTVAQGQLIMPPTAGPSPPPTPQPSFPPTVVPTPQPTSNPTIDKRPTLNPTFNPTYLPGSPTPQPITAAPSSLPSPLPTPDPTAAPSTVPTVTPTTTLPTVAPTPQPTPLPSASPTLLPTSQGPTPLPSVDPTVAPSSIPTPLPSSVPTIVPSPGPTLPTAKPTVTPTFGPFDPTPAPSVMPSPIPSALPSARPTVVPTHPPSPLPTINPTLAPTDPTPTPTSNPTYKAGDPTPPPSSMPTPAPSTSPPSAVPTASPTPEPTTLPTQPSPNPTARPTLRPSALPTRFPTRPPTAAPTSLPTTLPTIKPTSEPSVQPSPKPSPVPTLPLVPLSFAPTAEGDERAAFQVEQHLTGPGLTFQQWNTYNPNDNTAQSRCNWVFQSTVSAILSVVSGNLVNGQPTITPMDVSILSIQDVFPSMAASARRLGLRSAAGTTSYSRGNNKERGSSDVETSRRELQAGIEEVSVVYQVTFYPLSMGSKTPKAAYDRLLSVLQASTENGRFTIIMRRLAEENSNRLLQASNSSSIESNSLVSTPPPTAEPTLSPLPDPTLGPSPSPTFAPTQPAAPLLSNTNIIIVSVVLVFALALAIFVYFSCRKDKDRRVVIIKRPSQRQSVTTNPLRSSNQGPMYGGEGYQGSMGDDQNEESYPSAKDFAYGHGQAAYLPQGQNEGRSSRGSFTRTSFTQDAHRRVSTHDQVQQMMQAGRRLSNSGGLPGQRLSGQSQSEFGYQGGGGAGEHSEGQKHMPPYGL